MNSQRQGTICLVLGLVALSIYVGVNPAESERGQAGLQRTGGGLASGRGPASALLPGFVAVNSGIETLASDGEHEPKGLMELDWQSSRGVAGGVPGTFLRRFRGELQRRTEREAIVYDWRVDCYGLVPAESGERFVLLHSHATPKIGWSWFEQVPELDDVVVLLRMLADGRVRAVQGAQRWPLREVPIDLLLCKSAGPGQSDSAWRGADDTRYGLQWNTGSEQSDLRYCLTSDDDVRAKAQGIERRCLLGMDPVTRQVQTFEMESIRRERMATVRFDGSLELTATGEIEHDIWERLTIDAELWSNRTREIESAVNQFAGAVSCDAEGAAMEACDHRLADISATFRPPTLELRHEVTDCGYRSAVALGTTLAERLRRSLAAAPERGPATLPFLQSELAGQLPESDTAANSRVRVLAMVCRSATFTGSALRAMTELRSRFGVEEVEMAAVSTDFFEDDVRQIRACCDESLPVVRMPQTARQFQLLGVGMPLLVVVDSESRVRGMYPWHALIDVDAVANQVEALCREEGVQLEPGVSLESVASRWGS